MWDSNFNKEKSPDPISALLVTEAITPNIKKDNGINFVPFLIGMTGKFTIQPVVKNNVYFLLNGEIYSTIKTKTMIRIFFI